MPHATLLDIGDDGMLGQCPDGRKLWLLGPGVPGDTVAFVEEGKGGVISEVLEPAPDRVSPRCPHAEVCPGCQLQALPYARQLELKQSKIVETLKRLGGLEDVPFVGMVGSAEPYGTRNKLDFTLQGAEIGYQSRDGLVSVNTCPVGDPLLQAWIPRMKDWLMRHPTHGLHRLLLRTNSARDQVMVLLRGEWTGGEQEDFLQMAREEPAAVGVSIQADWKQPWRTVWGEEALDFEVAGASHRILHDRFFQVNH
jgi:23S rRNA (uracil1939-C5)-methyltransferase